jgi:multidrug efflux pump subunit AcrA (membrane-fusion protein)
MKKKHTIYIIALALSINFIFKACNKNQEIISDKKAPINVLVAEVKQHHIKEYLTFNGVTQYLQKETIRANVTGYISWMKYKIGDPIRMGQTFASVRTKEQDALKEAVKIDSSLKKFINPILINSNATGILTLLNITKNDYVAEGDILATVVQPKSLVIQLNVPFEYENDVQIGSLCEIILQNGETITSKITGILPTIDAVAQSQLFLIALPNANLPENLNVQVRTIYKEDATALTIPKSALQTNELLTAFWVLKVVNDSLAIKQKVHPLLKNDSLIQVKSTGLKVHDLVITQGGYQLQDSTIVSTKKR